MFRSSKTSLTRRKHTHTHARTHNRTHAQARFTYICNCSLIQFSKLSSQEKPENRYIDYVNRCWIDNLSYFLMPNWDSSRICPLQAGERLVFILFHANRRSPWAYVAIKCHRVRKMYNTGLEHLILGLPSRCSTDWAIRQPLSQLPVVL